MIIENIPVPVQLIICIVLLIIIYEVLMYLRGKSSETWRPHPAKVINLGIEVRQDEDGFEESKPFILYEYTVNNTIHNGSKIIYGDIWSSNYGKSFEDIKGLKKGSKITVYVNPKNFNMSVFKQGYRGNSYWVLGMLLIIIIVVIQNL